MRICNHHSLLLQHIFSKSSQIKQICKIIAICQYRNAQLSGCWTFEFSLSKSRRSRCEVICWIYSRYSVSKIGHSGCEVIKWRYSKYDSVLAACFTHWSQSKLFECLISNNNYLKDRYLMSNTLPTWWSLLSSCTLSPYNLYSTLTICILYNQRYAIGNNDTHTVMSYFRLMPHVQLMILQLSHDPSPVGIYESLYLNT